LPAQTARFGEGESVNRLYIAEKPSLAATIAQALGGGKKAAGYIETGAGIVTWCFGHLFEQAQPEDYDPRHKNWRLEDLPIVPAEWRLVPRSDAKKQIAVIRGLLKKAAEVVHAGDPDREGQLLVDEVLAELKWRGPTRRVWLTDLTEAGVKKALGDLKPNEQFAGLRAAAEARARADWLVGMNLTRAFTLRARAGAAGGGKNGVLSVGRVQTPTLALVVRCDQEIENFRPVSFYSVRATFAAGVSQYAGVWQVPEALADAEGRCLERAAADAVVARVAGKPGRVVSAESKPKAEPPPLPFSLAQLQAYASRRWGMGAQETLNVAQALYERHKLTTYPRTDCSHLAENQHAAAGGILAALASVAELAQHVSGASAERKSRAFDDKKITAHTAIIPTAKVPDLAALSEAERRVYLAVALRYIAQFYPGHGYHATVVLTEAEGERFRSTGRVVTAPGWRVLEAREDENEAGEENDETGELPAVKSGEPVRVAEAIRLDRQTKPPARFTEGSLIAAMAGIARFVTDPNVKSILRETSGIGTEATRAAIIELLKKRGWIEPKGEQIVSTPSARAFIASVPATLTDPSLTAAWELALAEIAEGKTTPEEFMRLSAELVESLLNPQGV
jgi:DNA topoisomerase-3